MCSSLIFWPFNDINEILLKENNKSSVTSLEKRNKQEKGILFNDERTTIKVHNAKLFTFIAMQSKNYRTLPKKS